MAKQQNQVQMPGVFGGLMRYDEEYSSRFMMNPGHVVAAIVAVVLLVIGLKIFFPISEGVVPNAGVPVHGGLALLISSLRSSQAKA